MNSMNAQQLASNILAEPHIRIHKCGCCPRTARTVYIVSGSFNGYLCPVCLEDVAAILREECVPTVYELAESAS